MPAQTYSKISLALIVPILISSATTRAADSVMLKPKLERPTDMYVEFGCDAQQKMTGPDGKPMEITTRSIFGLIEKATPTGESIEIEATIDRMLGSTAFGAGINTIYDSDNPEAEDASPDHRDAFARVLNKSVKLSLGKDGIATGVTGGDPIRAKLKELGDGNFIASQLADGDLADKQLKSLFGELPMALYANREVKVGESWKKTQKDEYQQVGRIIVNYDCKLDSIEKSGGGDVAIITYKGDLAKDDTERPEKDKRLGKIDGTFTGAAKFDVTQGRFIEITREGKAKIEVPPWWTKDDKAPLLKIDSTSKMLYTASSAADRMKRKAEIAAEIASIKAKREAEEAAAMAGPVDPPTPENAPVPWLQWGGTKRDFRSESTGLANRWPKGGPPKLWERQLGDAFSAIVCDGDTLYTMYSIRDKADQLKGDEIAIALDAKTGKTRWEYKYSVPWPKDMQMEFGAGPYSTPVLVGDKLYTVGCTAKLHCLDKKTGSVLWSKDLHEEYKADLLGRGVGASPLAYKGSIWMPVSKEKGFALMAFDQNDGKVTMKGGDFHPGYASLLAINFEGIEQIVAFTGKAVLGVDPTNGDTKWSVDQPTQWGGNISTPVWGDDNFLFISAAYGMGSRGVKLEKAGSQIGAKEAWFNPKMKIQHGDGVRVGDYVYGSSGDFGPTFLGCINVKTGEMGWRQRGISKATLVYADGKLIVLDEDGNLYLVKADPEKYRLLAKAPGLLKKTAWTVPTLIGRKLYMRDREKIMALDLSAKKE